MRHTHRSAPHWAGPCAVRALAVVVVVVALTRAAAGSVDRSRTHWVGKRVTLRVSDEGVADASWEVFYEPRTGRPYYHNRELDATQWTKPFAAVGLTNHLEADRVAARDAVTGGVRRMSGTAVGGVLLYDLFDFSHGAMDHLPCVRTLHGIQHRGWAPESVARVEVLAGVTIDEAQAQLEIGIAVEEAYCAAHGVDSQARRSRLAEAWNDLANVWFARGDWQVVMQCLRRALWWNPASDTALANMAGLMWELGCRDDAAQVEEFAADPQAYLNRVAALTDGVPELGKAVGPRPATIRALSTPDTEVQRHSASGVGDTTAAAEHSGRHGQSTHGAGGSPPTIVVSRVNDSESLKGDAHAGLRVATSSATAAVVEPAAASAGDATSLGGAGGAHGQSWVTHPAAQVAFVMLCAALVTLMSKRPTKPGGVPPNSDTSAATAPLTPRRRPGRRYGSASPASPASPAPRTVRGGIASTGRLSSPRKRSPGAGFSRSPPTPSRHV